jgi:CDP-glycerol glycerophosphotransferase (TagB/SpsB family)
VLIATSDLRETGRLDRRKAFIRKASEIAAGRQLVFKLHPNENKERAIREIRAIAPDALIFSEGNTSEMVANCDVLITQYSSVAYLGLALKKEVHSYFNLVDLHRLMPIQNGGHSGRIIAALCKSLLIKDRKVG